MLGSWRANAYDRIEYSPGGSLNELTDNNTFTMNVTEQYGCRFGGLIVMDMEILDTETQTLKIETQTQAFAATFHNGACRHTPRRRVRGRLSIPCD